MAKLVDKPISQLTKSEASSLIDRLRAMLPEQPQSGRDDRNGHALTAAHASMLKLATARRRAIKT
jgi:hypothetical protein